MRERDIIQLQACTFTCDRAQDDNIATRGLSLFVWLYEMLLRKERKEEGDSLLVPHFCNERSKAAPEEFRIIVMERWDVFTFLSFCPWRRREAHLLLRIFVPKEGVISLVVLHFHDGKGRVAYLSPPMMVGSFIPAASWISSSLVPVCPTQHVCHKSRSKSWCNVFMSPPACRELRYSSWKWRIHPAWHFWFCKKFNLATPSTSFASTFP